MLAFAEFVALMFVGFGLLCWLVHAVEHNYPGLRNPLAFCLAFGGAYAASFSLDIFVGAIWGLYKFSPFTVPVFTWAGIAFSLYLLATSTAISPTALRIPYLLIGAIAALAGIIGPHRHSILVGAPLLIIGFVAEPANPPRGFSRLGLVEATLTPSTSSQPTYEELVQRLRELESGSDMAVTEPLSMAAYELDSTVARYPQLVEYSQLEYEQAHRRTSHENTFKAPLAVFLDTEWEIEITSVRGWVRGITAQSACDSQLTRSFLHKSAFRYYQNKFGDPTKTSPGVAVWRTLGGQVVLCYEGDTGLVVIGLTSWHAAFE